MRSLLDKAYQNTSNTNISNNSPNNNSIFKPQEATKTESPFDTLTINPTSILPIQFKTPLKKSHEITKIQNLASTFKQNLSELGEAMYKNGIIDKAEKLETRNC